MAKSWISVEKAAPVLDMNKDQLYRVIREGKFPFRFERLGRIIRISAEDIGFSDSENEKNEAQTQGQSLPATS
jgi:excisionase family DNA binding protein